MRICWPHAKAILDPATATLRRHPAGEPYEMPDEEAADRIRQGDCVAYVEPESRRAADGDHDEQADDESVESEQSAPPPGPAPAAVTVQEG